MSTAVKYQSIRISHTGKIHDLEALNTSLAAGFGVTSHQLVVATGDQQSLGVIVLFRLEKNDDKPSEITEFYQPVVFPLTNSETLDNLNKQLGDGDGGQLEGGFTVDSEEPLLSEPTLAVVLFRLVKPIGA